MAFEFEQEIELGFQSDNRQTFEKYANYFIDLQRHNGCAVNTLIMYKYLMKRLVPLIGHMKLKDIRPQHISGIDRELSEGGIRQEPGSAKAKGDIRAVVYEKFPSQRALAAASGVCVSTMCDCCKGRRIGLASAEKFAAALGKEVEELFNVITSDAPLSGQTLERYHCFITSVLRQAEREMLIPYNPGLKVAPPKAEKKEPNYFQPETVADIIGALEDEPIRWRAMVHLFLVTGFRRDRDALIEKGFIACVEDGSPTRTKSVYRFSSMWQKYGKEGFCVHDCDKTASMMKKVNKKGGMKRPTPTSSGTQEMTFVPESERKVQCGKTECPRRFGSGCAG